MKMKVRSDTEDKLEKILRLLDNLTSELVKGIPIIVEGRKDIEVLNELEVRGDIIAAKTRSGNLSDLLDEVEERHKNEVILLMDFDRRGKEMTNYLAQRLEEMKIAPNTTFWRDLSGLLRRDIKDIQGLSSYIKTLKRKIREAENRI